MPAISRISTDIDFDARGRHSGYLRVPWSSDVSAYGHIPVPIHVIGNGPGPTALLTGGVHGDEYEGPVSLMKLARELEPDEVRGRVIIVPALNLPAVEAGRRCSPIDGVNMNRCFPGVRDGSPTQMLAHHVSAVLLPMADVQIDLHAGGTTLEYIPTLIFHECDDRERFARTLAAARLAGLPIVSIENPAEHGGLFEMECEAQGVMNMNCELGGAGRVTRDYVAMADFALRNVLRFTGVLAGRPKKPVTEPRLVDVNHAAANVHVYERGLFEPFVELGEKVRARQPLGQVHFPSHASREPVPVAAGSAGTVLVKRPPGRVEPGDLVFIVARDYRLRRR